MSEQSPNQPNIIDHVPSPDEIRRPQQLGMRMLEYVDPVVAAGDSTESQVGHRGMIARFADKLHFAGPDAMNSIARDAYGIARQLGDEAISARSEAAFALLEGSRTRARLNAAFLDSAGAHEAEGYVSLQKMKAATDEDKGPLSHRNKFGLDISSFREGGATFVRAQETLEQRGVSVRPHDLSTLLALQASGHEAGHMIENGLIPSIKQVVGEAQVPVTEADAAAMVMVASRPESRGEGDLATDASRHNERFAEGYGMLVMSEAARALGYDEAKIHAIVEAAGLPMEKDVNNTGYSQPLSEAEIVQGLEDIGKVVHGNASIDTQSYESHGAASAAAEVVDEKTIRRPESRYRRVAASVIHRMLGTRRS